MSISKSVNKWFSKAPGPQPSTVEDSLREIAKSLGRLCDLIDNRLPEGVAENLKHLSCRAAQSSKTELEDLRSRLTQLERGTEQSLSELRKCLHETLQRTEDSRGNRDSVGTESPPLNQDSRYRISSIADLEDYIISAWMDVRKTGSFTVENLQPRIRVSNSIEIHKKPSLIIVFFKHNSEVIEYFLPDPNVSVESCREFYDLGQHMTASNSNYIIQKLAFRRNGYTTKGILSAP